MIRNNHERRYDNLMYCINMVTMMKMIVWNGFVLLCVIFHGMTVAHGYTISTPPQYQLIRDIMYSSNGGGATKSSSGITSSSWISHHQQRNRRRRQQQTKQQGTPQQGMLLMMMKKSSQHDDYDFTVDHNKVDSKINNSNKKQLHHDHNELNFISDFVNKHIVLHKSILLSLMIIVTTIFQPITVSTTATMTSQHNPVV